MHKASGKDSRDAGSRPDPRFLATLFLLFALFALTFGAALFFLFTKAWLLAATSILLAFGVVFVFDRVIRTRADN